MFVVQKPKYSRVYFIDFSIDEVQVFQVSNNVEFLQFSANEVHFFQIMLIQLKCEVEIVKGMGRCFRLYQKDNSTS